jgi:hypothetical protein
MAANNPPAETPTLSEYERGYLNALAAYAWWKDGATYVGSGVWTLAQAMLGFAERSSPAALAYAVGYFKNSQLEETIANERQNGRAFGPIAEACRLELTRRTGQAAQ